MRLGANACRAGTPDVLGFAALVAYRSGREATRDCGGHSRVRSPVTCIAHAQSAELPGRSRRRPKPSLPRPRRPRPPAPTPAVALPAPPAAPPSARAHARSVRWGDFTWMNGQSRQKDFPLKAFGDAVTLSLYLDFNYAYSAQPSARQHADEHGERPAAQRDRHQSRLGGLRLELQERHRPHLAAVGLDAQHRPGPRRHGGAWSLARDPQPPLHPRGGRRATTSTASAAGSTSRAASSCRTSASRAISSPRTGTTSARSSASTRRSTSTACARSTSRPIA